MSAPTAMTLTSCDAGSTHFSTRKNVHAVHAKTASRSRPDQIRIRQGQRNARRFQTTCCHTMRCRLHESANELSTHRCSRSTSTSRGVHHPPTTRQPGNPATRNDIREAPSLATGDSPASGLPPAGIHRTLTRNTRNRIFSAQQ